MSNKSGTSSQVISLPKGGGALQGIGEKFSPDLHTGTGNFTIPIALPPGRNGFQSQINLVYSTGNGNSVFGLGWSLSIPGVMRKTSEGIPRYDDLRDTFVLSGAEDLVPVERQSNRTFYQPRTEGLFAKIIHHRNASNNYWEVRSKDGLVSLYGTPGVAGNDLAAIAHPVNLSQIFAWKLTRTTDPFGNRIDYIYERDVIQTDGPHQWSQLYLSEIRYVDYGDPDNPQYLIGVKFTYEDRPDPFSEYRAGFEIRTVRRCQRIEVFTQPGREILTRTYHLSYLDEQGFPVENLPLNRVSLLSQVNVVGHDGTGSESLPALEFNYTQFEPQKRYFFPITGPDLPPGSLARPEYELADLLGNGLPDILEMNGIVRYWRNLGNGRFDRPCQMRDAPAGLQLSDSGVQLIDADGDGRIDLLVTREGLSGYFPLRFSGFWDRRSFQRYEFAPSFDLEDPEVKLVDLNGDGVTDAIRSGSRLECFFNDSEIGWQETRAVERRSLVDFPNINFSDSRVKWGDMTGDGLQDIVLVYDGNIEYWPNLGYGNWGKRISMRNSPRFRYGYDPKRILIGDIDGDGLADIVYVDDRKVILWINQSGNAWSDPIEIKGTPPVTDIDAVRLVDLLGTGISGVLWSADADGLSREQMFFFDFTGGIKPYLLSEMDNHMGSLTRVGYAPSTQFYLEDEQHIQTRWKTPLPFPVQVVAKVEVIDQISQGKLTTQYRYHHGYWDGAEREFRGFGRVEQLDTETFADYNQPELHGEEREFQRVDEEKYFSAPMLTKTWFHQGPVGDEFGDWEELDYSAEYWIGDPQVLERPFAITESLNSLPRRAKRDALRTLRGQILRTEMYALDDTERQAHPYTVTEAVHGVHEEVLQQADDSKPQRIFFSFPLAQRTTQWERGDEPMTQFSFMEDYDEYGQPRQQFAIACARGWRNWTDERQDYLATYAETTFAQQDDDQVYIVDRTATATSYEIKLGAAMTVEQLRQAVVAGTVEQQVIGQSLNFYDGEAFTGLSIGQVNRYGALVRSETLVLDEAKLREAYGDEVPPYLNSSGTTDWIAEYPIAFREALLVSGTSDLTRPGLTILPTGHGFATGGALSPYHRGYYVATARNQYDFHTNLNGRGLLRATRDPLGRETQIEYDNPYELLPVAVTDAVGLVTQAVYDYRVLQPREVTDPNGNRQHFSFTPLGLPAWIAVMGKVGESVGNTDDVPGNRFEYDFLAFERSQQPISVRTIKRSHHITETDVPLPARDETIETVEYTDGFGRLLQTRTQAEDVTFGDATFGNDVLSPDQSVIPEEAVGRQRGASDPINVVVSGWQIYDNKGRVVEKYEPFYGMGWDYAEPRESERGQKAQMYYDPRGQVIRTVNPDGSEQRVIYGVPEDLSNPEQFTPTPWEAYTYDANDNAGRSHGDRGAAYQPHWNTPSNAVVDALGRTVLTIERNRTKQPDGTWSAIAEYHTKSTYDIRGNLLTVTDTLEREAFRYVYDLTPKGKEKDSSSQVLKIENIDAGVRRVGFNALGNELERRDSKGALILQAYDLLNRPTNFWARDGIGQPVTLRERLEYGDGGTPNQPAAERLLNRNLNRLGQPVQHDDEAGRVRFESYDFKGNGLEKVRQVIGDAAILAVFPERSDPAPDWQIQAFRIDWQTATDSILDSQEYRTSASYDALNRVKQMRYPQAVDGERKVLRPQYNRAGALERVELDGAIYVEHIAYNAKGQRSLIVYGNGVMTRYAYDPQTFRLARLRTERISSGGTFTYLPTARDRPLQDFAYRYDLVGNILSITDRTPGSGYQNNPEAVDVADAELRQLLASGDALIRQFEYDPIYRLTAATGRECDRPPEAPPWMDEPRCADLTRTRGYRQEYRYDSMGNMQRLRHEHYQADGSVNGRNRDFALVTGSNRLNTVAFGETIYTYGYDDNGNLINESTARHFEWDHGDRLKVFCTQTGNAEPSVHAHYLYDASGQRVKKLVRKQGGQVEVTVYIDGMFEYHRLVQGGSILENNTLHMMDDQQRIALVRVGTPFPDERSPSVRYHLGDHLGSSNVVIGDDGVWVNREEFTPYGETSFGSFARKQYRFTGRERDEESGLNYHGARYYAPWLVRWISCDPAGMIDGINLYAYVHNNPIRLLDKQGMNSTLDDEAIANLRYLQHLANTVPQNEFPDEIPSVRGQRAHLTMEAAITMGIDENVIPGANSDRIAPEIQIDENGIIQSWGRDPGRAGSGWRTIDAAVLQEGVTRESIVGMRASDAIEVAVDYKTGNASMSGVTALEELINAPYVPLRQGGNVVATAERKSQTLARRIYRILSNGVSNVPSSGSRSMLRILRTLLGDAVHCIPYVGAAMGLEDSREALERGELMRGTLLAAGAAGLEPADWVVTAYDVGTAYVEFMRTGGEMLVETTATYMRRLGFVFSPSRFVPSY
ncbi:MAG: SpvB/TcaC N-terminal domain-containing protein [Aulosira sp. DedQUE10]|nr:SpvB/TcaC N-terminal domain-containing protein [Aulosira sp. DedQUE10]